MGCKKQGAKTSDPVFCTLLFTTHILNPFFKVPDPKKISDRPDKLEKWVQIDWATVYAKPFWEEINRHLNNFGLTFYTYILTQEKLPRLELLVQCYAQKEFL
jgi:hypothetical protein